MIEKVSQNRVPFLAFPALEEVKGISHAVFTRKDGISKGPYAELNCGANTGDDPEKVARNREAAARALGARSLAFLIQVHGSRVKVLKAPGPGLVWETREEADALATDRSGLFVAVAVADCQPVLLADPVKKKVAAVHSGWKGSLVNVIGKSVETMAQAFGSDPSDIIACVGPSLGPCCSEFVNYKKEIPERFWKYKTGKNHFDFWQLSRDQLKAEGVLSENIHVAGLCTSCGTDLFYSYRRENITGRFVAAIGLTGG